jgi:predicted acylesterase/phospholipase RssA
MRRSIGNGKTRGDIGLALSGGGSRAAAFHRGTVRALHDLGVLPRVDTLSSVSGGSVFAAAWLAAKARGKSELEFLDWMGEILERGFITEALVHWRALKILLPGFSRTHRIAETFDEVLFDGLDWPQLPKEPLLCLNTACMNNAATGRWSQNGFSCAGIGKRDPVTDSWPEGPVKNASIGFATATSAAFPFGLPPLPIARDRFGFDFVGKDFVDCTKLLFTDGGILENLGTERLLHSTRFGTDHVISSDAGQREQVWQPGIIGRLKSAGVFALSAETLDRLLLMMNNKQNKSARELLFAAKRDGKETETKKQDARRVLFIQLKQDWRGLVPDERDDAKVPEARKLYDEMAAIVDVDEVDDGDKAAAYASGVSTSFVGLPPRTLALLSAHAEWQVHAAVRLYAPDLLPSAAPQVSVR